MTRLPSLSGEKIIQALNRASFTIDRQKGSHVYLKHVDGRATVVPVHKGECVGRGLMSKILRDTDLSREDFLRLL
jgi:predicted RNA binding protein YcfA (HicA-like mRNA interferase family)